MSNVVQVAVDPHLMCLPNPCRSADQIELFVNSLLGWCEIVHRQDTHILMADVVRIALLNDNEYPYSHRLREVLKRFRYDAVDHETVCRVAQNIIDSMPSLEDYFGVRCVIYEEDCTQILPPYLHSRLHGQTRDSLVEMLVILAAGRRLGPRASSIVVFATSPVPVSNQAADELSIAANIDAIEWQDESWVGHAPLPCSVREKLTLADCYKSLTRQLGIWALWQNATTTTGARDAIDVCVEELVASGVDGTKRSHYEFGEHFLDSVRNWGFGVRPDHASVLIESCARIILGIPKNPVNEFRESSNSTKQRTRDDGASAFRTHLTKKGAGFRLMLWRLMDGSIEFANVGDKDELAIM